MVLTRNSKMLEELPSSILQEKGAIQMSVRGKGAKIGEGKESRLRLTIWMMNGFMQVQFL